MPLQTVTQGECVSSIAARHGLLWRTIWEHPANDGLRNLRQSHNVLLPEDELFVPERNLKKEPAPTEQRHRFKRLGTPAFFRMRIVVDDQPLRDVPFRLTVDGRHVTGRTDADGCLTAKINPRAVVGLLALGDPGRPFLVRVRLRHLDPIDSVTGLQQRLSNLGFHVAVSGMADEATASALRHFQQTNGLEATSQLDSATRSKLEALHAC